MRIPKLALAIAIHEGAIALMVDHGEGAMDRHTAIKRSREAMETIVGDDLDVSLETIENERFWA